MAELDLRDFTGPFTEKAFLIRREGSHAVSTAVEELAPRIANRHLHPDGADYEGTPQAEPRLNYCDNYYRSRKASGEAKGPTRRPRPGGSLQGNSWPAWSAGVSRPDADVVGSANRTS